MKKINSFDREIQITETKQKGVGYLINLIQLSSAEVMRQLPLFSFPKEFSSVWETNSVCYAPTFFRVTEDSPVKLHS